MTTGTRIVRAPRGLAHSYRRLPPPRSTRGENSGPRGARFTMRGHSTASALSIMDLRGVLRHHDDTTAGGGPARVGGVKRCPGARPALRAARRPARSRRRHVTRKYDALLPHDARRRMPAAPCGRTHNLPVSSPVFDIPSFVPEYVLPFFCRASFSFAEPHSGDLDDMARRHRMVKVRDLDRT